MSTKDGYITISRELFNNALWSDKPYARGQAWIDMIRMASYNDRNIMLGSKIVKVKRGDFITSEAKLAEKWGWSRNKVRAFLKLLVDNESIYKQGTREYTTVTIVNYSFYQLPITSKGTTEGQPKEQRQNNVRTTSEQPKDNQRYTNNKKNKINKKNKEKEIDITDPFVVEF